jgi:hypothetical protein
MKHLTALTVLVLASPAIAHRENAIINSATELRDWCKEESEASIIGGGVTPYNWTASYWDQGNVLFVKGKWRVNASNVTVECSIARGAEARFASMTVGEPVPGADAD